MKKKYQVFISSTYTDLIEERIAAVQCLLDNDCIPVGMEQFPASGMSQMEYIRKMLDDCDYYLLILAGRYGSIDSDGIGFTEKEFDYASGKGIPIMSFVIKDTGKLPNDKCEQSEKLRKKLEEFRKKVCEKRLVKMYSDIGELKTGITTALYKCIRDFPAPGWVRGDLPGLDVEVKIPHDLENKEKNVKIQVSDTSKSNCYINLSQQGVFKFDYSNNDGKYTIGSGLYTFTTQWSKASDTSVYAYKDPDGIEAIALLKAPVDLNNIESMESDFSSRIRTAQIGDAVIWKNANGKYAITKIIKINDNTRGDANDEIQCEYIMLA